MSLPDKEVRELARIHREDDVGPLLRELLQYRASAAGKLADLQRVAAELIQMVVRDREETGHPHVADGCATVGSVRVKVKVRIDNEGILSFEVKA